MFQVFTSKILFSIEYVYYTNPEKLMKFQIFGKINILSSIDTKYRLDIETQGIGRQKYAYFIGDYRMHNILKSTRLSLR